MTRLADIRKAAAVEPDPRIQQHYADMLKRSTALAQRAEKFLDQWRGELNGRDIQQLEAAISYAREDGGDDSSIYEAMERLWTSGPMEASAAAGKFLQGSPRSRSSVATNPLYGGGLESVTLQRDGNLIRLTSSTGEDEAWITMARYESGLREYLSYKQQQAILNGETVEAKIHFPAGAKWKAKKSLRAAMRKVK